MRILFIAPRFHTNQYQTVKTLQDAGHKVFFHVASVGSTEDHTLLVPNKFEQCKLSIIFEKMFGVGGVNKPNYFPNPFHYWKPFKKLKADIIVIRNPYRYFSLIAAFFSLFTKTRVIFYTQEELYRIRTVRTKIKQSLTMKVFKAAWMSPIEGVHNIRNTKLRHMYYVPIPIQVKKGIAIKEIADDDCPKILMIGKYHQERKKHLLLLKAINKLKDKYQFKLTIVGECTREVQIQKFAIIEAFVRDLGLENIVDLKKNVPFNQMEALYKAHDIFVLPSINEPHGVTVTEALAYGLPVICTDTCGSRFSVLDGKNGYVIKSDSLDELTNALEKLVSNKNTITKMSMNTFDYVQHHLSGKAFYNSFYSMINDRFKVNIKTA